MSRLSETVHPYLTNKITEILFSKSIFNTLNFVETNSEFLTRVTGLHYKQVLQIRDVIFSQHASKLCTGLNYYQDIMMHSAIFPSGVQTLDGLLGGGYETGKLYEICGTSACGKTQICLTSSVNMSLVLQQNIVYIDTKNDVLAHRILQIVENHPKKDSDVGSVLHRIKMFKVYSPYDLVKVLHSLKEASFQYRFIIIDSLTALFYRFLGENQTESLSLLNSISNLLQYLAVELHIVVLVTNLVTTWTSSADVNIGDDESTATGVQQVTKAALGSYWAHIPAMRMYLKQLASTQVLLTIVKSTNKALGKTIKVSITDAGVV